MRRLITSKCGFTPLPYQSTALSWHTLFALTSPRKEHPCHTSHTFSNCAIECCAPPPLPFRELLSRDRRPRHVPHPRRRTSTATTRQPCPHHMAVDDASPSAMLKRGLRRSRWVRGNESTGCMVLPQIATISLCTCGSAVLEPG